MQSKKIMTLCIKLAPLLPTLRIEILRAVWNAMSLLSPGQAPWRAKASIKTLSRFRFRLFFGFSLVVSLTSFSGCALGVRVPTNRFDSPETEGPGRGHMDALGIVGASSLAVTPDETASPPDLGSAVTGPSSSAHWGLDLGIVNRLDLGLRANTDAAWMAQFKYQLAGPNHAQALELIDDQDEVFSAALTLGFNFYSAKGSVDSNQVHTEHDLSVSGIDLSGIIGYRLSRTFLPYAGLFTSANTYSGNITQTPTGGIPSIYPLSGRLNQTGVDVGLQVEAERLLFKIEESFVRANGETNNLFGLYTGASAGFSF